MKGNPDARPNHFLFAVTLGGLFGSAAGFILGGFIGAATCDWSIKEAGCLRPSIYGAIIGNSVLMPVGVMLSNWRQHRFSFFLLTLLAVGGIGAAGLIVAFATGLGGIIIAIPVIQLIGCIAIYRAALSSNLASYEG